MTSVPILIGGTAGSVATKLLLQMGFPVRAIVRGDDERAQSLAPSAPKSLSLIFSICALSGAPSNDRARSAGRRGDHLGLGVRLRLESTLLGHSALALGMALPAPKRPLHDAGRGVVGAGGKPEPLQCG